MLDTLCLIDQVVPFVLSNITRLVRFDTVEILILFAQHGFPLDQVSICMRGEVAPLLASTRIQVVSLNLPFQISTARCHENATDQASR